MKPRISLDPSPKGEDAKQGAPKTTVLGIAQAKRRLHAFSLLRQNSLLGSPKKSTGSKEKTPAKKVADDKKPKTTTLIEEIEELKKQEHDYLKSLKEKIQAKKVLNEGAVDSSQSKEEVNKGRESGKEKRKERKKSHSPSPAKQKYPANWSELLEMRLELSDLKSIKNKKVKNGCIDYRKHLAFEKNSSVVSALRIANNHGQETSIPPFRLRYTKNHPSISYSTNASCFLSRKEIFSELPKASKSSCQKIIDSCSPPPENDSFPKVRYWYPRNTFSAVVVEEVKRSTDCEILEPSVVLSSLKNYSDVEDEEETEEDKQKTENAPSTAVVVDVTTGSPKQPKEKKDEEVRKGEGEERIKKEKRGKKKKKKKSKPSDENREKKRKAKKKKEKKSELKRSKSPQEERKRGTSPPQKIQEEESLTPDNKPKAREKPKEQTVKDDKAKRRTNKKSASKERSKPEDRPKERARSEGEKRETKETTDRNRSPPSKKSKTGRKQSPIQKNRNKSPPQAQTKTSTPDTDEYHSLWESDDEAALDITSPTKKRLSNSWESDEEKFDRNRSRRRNSSDRRRSSRSLERCLEMPLNIKNLRRNSSRDEKPTEATAFKFVLFAEDDSWEKDVVSTDEVRRLEEERRTISEERRLLQLERKKLEELERKRYYEIHRTSISPLYEGKSYDVPMEGKESVSPFYKKSFELEEPLFDTFKRNRDSEHKRVTYRPSEKKTRWGDRDKEKGTAETAVESRKRKSETEPLTEDAKPKKEKIDLPSPQVKKLENEYEEFMKAVSSDVPAQEAQQDKKKKRNLPSSSSSSTSSSSTSSTSSSSSSSSSESEGAQKSNRKKKKTKRKRAQQQQKTACFDDFVIEPKESTDDLGLLPPQPVPSPDTTPLTAKEAWRLADSTSSPAVTVAKKPLPDHLEPPNWSMDSSDDKPTVATSTITTPTPTAAFDFSSITPITLTNKRRPLGKPSAKLDDASSEDDEKQRKSIRDRKPTGHERRVEKPPLPPPLPPPPSKEEGRTVARKRSRSRTRSPPRRRRSTEGRRRASPVSHRSKRRGFSPRRPRRRSLSPVVRRGRRDSRRSPPVRRGGGAASRRRSDSVSPRRRSRTKSPIKDQYRKDFKKSPLRSPVDSLKRNVAPDSTISDDQLPQFNSDASPLYGYHLSEAPSKRMPLDVRINQVLLGCLEREPPPPPPPIPQQKPIETAYPSLPINYDHHDYQYHHALQETPYSNYSNGPTKVVQVGNMIQIVPTEECLSIPQHTQQILQVGNMLQIVPSETAAVEPPKAEAKPPAEDPEARLKEKRTQEREKRRKEKERKRKEKEKKKQMKLKMRTERMIKRALLLEIEEETGEETENQENVNGPWPPVPIVLNNAALKPAGKGILLTHGASKLNIKVTGEGSDLSKKSVKFADGICPGEGTSPSGGEELSSPPPPRLPKEKRYKKTRALKKKSKKKKVKVKVIRKTEPASASAPLSEGNDEEEEDVDEEDNLPPPPPPPGSPPPHVFPPRVKTHTINNVHPSNFFAAQHQAAAAAVYRQQPALAFGIPPPPPAAHLLAHSPAVIHPARPPF